MPKRKKNAQVEGVSFLHFRILQKREHADGSEFLVQGSGGATLAYVEIDGLALGALAYCHPKDTFNKTIGRNKAEGRLKQLVDNPDLADDDVYFTTILEDDESIYTWLATMTNHLQYLGYN